MGSDGDDAVGGTRVRYCNECKHFEWVKPREGGMPSIYNEGIPSCSNPNAWLGVKVLAIGVPLNIGWARSEGSSCGDAGELWESRE